MRDSIKETLCRIEDVLAPHGYYFHLNDEQSQLSFTFTEIGLFTLGLIIWTGTQYLKNFLSEKGKIDANRLFGANQHTEEELISMLNELRTEVQGLKKHSEDLNTIVASGISEQSLILMLREVGMTERASVKISRDVHLPLCDELRRLFKDWQS